MTGVEIDMVVTASLKALELYEKIFEVKRIEVTDYPKGTNEAVFTIYDTRFHMLDENPEYQLIAPKPGQPQSGEGHRVVEKHLKRSEDIRFDEELQDSVGHSGDQAGFGPVDVTDQADKHHGK